MENSPNYNLISSPSEDAWWPVPFHLTSNSSVFSSSPEVRVYTANNNYYYYYDNMGQQQQQQNQHYHVQHQPEALLDITPSASDDSTTTHGTHEDGFGAQTSGRSVGDRSKREPLSDITKACNKTSRHPPL
jgi:hypothetical protein